jgi:hypothetical protein
MTPIDKVLALIALSKGFPGRDVTSVRALRDPRCGPWLFPAAAHQPVARAPVAAAPVVEWQEF